MWAFGGCANKNQNPVPSKDTVNIETQLKKDTERVKKEEATMTENFNGCVKYGVPPEQLKLFVSNVWSVKEELQNGEKKYIATKIIDNKELEERKLTKNLNYLKKTDKNLIQENVTMVLSGVYCAIRSKDEPLTVVKFNDKDARYLK